MEVVAPRGLTAAPFALCPRFNLLAVGMASSPVGRGGAEEIRASRVDILRLLRPSGDHDLASTLQVDCVLRAPGLTKVAWSSEAKSDFEQLIDPFGLLAGGFKDGAVRVWRPATALPWSMGKCVPEKPEPVLILNDDDLETAQELETKMSTGVSDMYSAIDKATISWSHSEGKQALETEEEDDWHKVDKNADSSEWEMVSKEPVADHQEMTQMELLAETHNLRGPVLGLSFNELYPYWIGTAAVGECIYVHDLCDPSDLPRKKHELWDSSKGNTQVTCLKWSRIYPCVLASSDEAGTTKIWDVRMPAGRSVKTFAVRGTMSPDLEFSWNNPMLFAVSSRASATVKIWDMRYLSNPVHEYASGDSGVLSLSWNRLGELLSSNINGGVSCYDVYKEKMVQDRDFPHCDLGLTWTHSENVAALLSSKTGVKLYEMGR